MTPPYILLVIDHVSSAFVSKDHFFNLAGVGPIEPRKMCTMYYACIESKQPLWYQDDVIDGAF